MRKYLENERTRYQIKFLNKCKISGKNKILRRLSSQRMYFIKKSTINNRPDAVVDPRVSQRDRAGRVGMGVISLGSNQPK